MSRPAASDRIRRLLSLVPWVASHPDGVAIAEVCARFQIPEATLLADLDTLMMVGLPPYTPDTYVDVIVDDDRVRIAPQWFDRPLRLTAEQALALVTAGESLLSVPGADPDGPLARGLAKVAGALGVERAVLEVDHGRAEPEVLGLLEAARDGHHPVVLDYYAYGRDERTERTVEPWAVYHDQGSWYVQGWCRLADGERVFRVDRIHTARALDETFSPPDEAPTLGVFDPGPDDPSVTLELAPSARLVTEQYPCQEIVELDDGGRRVTLVVTAAAWLERLLVRLGPEARVVEGPEDLVGAGRRAADRVLARYRSTPGDPGSTDGRGPEALG